MNFVFLNLALCMTGERS